MIICSPVNVIKVNFDENPSRESLMELIKKYDREVVLEIHSEGMVYHATHEAFENNCQLGNLGVNIDLDIFGNATELALLYGKLLLKNETGDYVAALKYVPTYYSHAYRYEGGLDMEFLNRYDCIYLHGVNEYSIELYRRALPLWTGKKAVLTSGIWSNIVHLLPELLDKEVVIENILENISKNMSENISENMSENLNPNGAGYNILHIMEFLPQNEDNSRYLQGIMSYDEIMTLTFMFSYLIHPGKLNPDKKFFVIDGMFRLEGLFAIWDKAFTVARYVKKKGYIPVFEIVSSDDNMYSDCEGDDIWNKFFMQPEGYTLEEIHRSQNLILSSNMNVLNVMRYIMDEFSAGTQLEWPDGMFNRKVESYIDRQMEMYLPHPEKTLGVLIRGTDYVKTNLPGHAKHASVDMIVEKIEAVQEEWGKFDYIYLATEDADVCSQMQEIYGDRLYCTDQERYSVKENQLLYQLHTEKKEGNGFRLGVEYLATLRLLSRCKALIASGGCCGVNEAIRENEGRYEHVYVFNLGVNPR